LNTSDLINTTSWTLVSIYSPLIAFFFCRSFFFSFTSSCNHVCDSSCVSSCNETCVNIHYCNGRAGLEHCQQGSFSLTSSPITYRYWKPDHRYIDKPRNYCRECSFPPSCNNDCSQHHGF